MKGNKFSLAYAGMMASGVLTHMRNVAYTPINFMKERKDDDFLMKKAADKRACKAASKQTQNLIKGNKNV